MGQSNFKTISRDQYFDAHLKTKTNAPPVGAYRMRYESVDKRVTGKMYGT